MAARLLAVCGTGTRMMASSSSRMMKEKKAHIAKARDAGRVVGESRATEHFFKEWMHKLPRLATPAAWWARAELRSISSRSGCISCQGSRRRPRGGREQSYGAFLQGVD